MKRTQILLLIFILSVVDLFGQGLVNFSGVIKDINTGNPLEGINIFIPEKNIGTITDVTGEFLVFLSGGRYNVIFSANGYKTQTLFIDLKEDKSIEILLTPSSEMKKKNELLSKRKGTLDDEINIGKTKTKTIKSS